MCAISHYVWQWSSCHRADEMVARVPKIAHGKISLARCIHCATACFVLTLPDQRLYIVQNMCVYIHTYQTAYRLYTNYRCYPNNTAVKHLNKSERCEVLTGYLSLGRRPGGDWANAWHWTERFTVFFWNRKQQQQPTATATFCSYRIPGGGLYCKYNNYTVNPLNAELNPICYLLALLGAHHFLHVSRIRVKSLTLRLLMSYIWSTYSWCF